MVIVAVAHSDWTWEMGRRMPSAVSHTVPGWTPAVNEWWSTMTRTSNPQPSPSPLRVISSKIAWARTCCGVSPSVAPAVW